MLKKKFFIALIYLISLYLHTDSECSTQSRSNRSITHSFYSGLKNLFWPNTGISQKLQVHLANRTEKAKPDTIRKDIARIQNALQRREGTLGFLLVSFYTFIGLQSSFTPIQKFLINAIATLSFVPFGNYIKDDRALKKLIEIEKFAQYSL